MSLGKSNRDKGGWRHQKKDTLPPPIFEMSPLLSQDDTSKTSIGLPIIDEQIFQLANGQQEKYPIVGPIDLRFENRATTTRAVLLPGDAEPLLGQIPLEDMDVVLLPREERMIVNPDTPLIARKDLL